MFREVRGLRERLVTPGAFEWLVAVMHPLMDSKSPHDGEPLSASRVITFVRLWGLGQSQNRHLRRGTHSLVCAVACVVATLQPLRNTVDKPRIDVDGVLYATAQRN